MTEEELDHEILESLDNAEALKIENERLRAVIRGFIGHFVTAEMSRKALEQ